MPHALLGYGEHMQLTRGNHSLHPTKYPWEHEKWSKTFDHTA
jgi:ubiquinol-cytochrome c reductase cytochrome c1 subunit